tara:strand:- start:66 stop:320 length:255 start_codon:yes stop_codon:yes gene_type:complete
MTMASSEKKLTEAELREGILSAILKNIVMGRTDYVIKQLQDNPRLKKATKDVEKAVSKLDRTLAKRGRSSRIDLGKGKTKRMNY